MKTLAIPFLFLFFSCNSFTEHTKNQVDGEIAASKQEMNLELQNLEKVFDSLYLSKTKSLIDSFDRQKLQAFFFSIDNTNKYLDSLKNEMDRLDPNDVGNVKVVEIIFLYDGAGDSLFSKINISMTAAQNAARTEGQRIEIKAAQDSLFDKPADKWKEQLFGMTNPLGAKMIIYGLQTELYRVGMKTLKEH